jgi:hypothetical protein
MHPDVLFIASVGDIHLGHKRNPAREIIANLDRAFPDNAETGLLDIIFVEGDVFDDLLSLTDEEVADIDFWIVRFLRICAKYDIAVVVLKGTPSHDWEQSQRFVTLNEAARLGADLTYVNTLSILYMERFGINVLCIPDEWETSTDKTLEQVHELMKAKGLTQVDYTVMHGQFPHQLPAVARAPVHNPEAYLKLTRKLVFVGHVHHFTKYDRIIAAGSFDRLAQGEEEPKGHVRAKVYRDDEMYVQFIENEGAKKFITIDCVGLELEETIARIDERVKDLPDDSYVRVRAEHTATIFTNMEMLVRRYPLLSWSKDPRSEEEEKQEVYGEDESIYVPITLTRDNLPGMLMERITNAGASAEVLKAAEELLKESA